MEKVKDYEEAVIDIDEIDGTDIKIKPDYYIHKALLSAQESLKKDNIKEGWIQYRQFIEYIETLCNAADMLQEDYMTNLENFKKSKEYQQEPSADIKNIKLANKKLYLIMREVFESTTATFKGKL